MPVPPRLPLLLALASLAACAPTTYETGSSGTGTGGTTATTTGVTVPSGPASELLPRLVTTMISLSSYIGPDAGQSTKPGKNLVLTDIDNLWNAVVDEVTATDPVAAESLGRMVDLAHTAVERNRPADADKAAKFAGQVVDEFLAG